MPATALDSLIFRDIFRTPEMRQVFSDEQRTGYYLEIEAALARVQARLGIIPQEAAREIGSKCRVENIDFAKLKAADRAHRLSDPRRGAADRRALRATGSANGATGAPPRRTSPTPRPSCRSAPRSIWSKTTWRRSPPRSPTLRGAIATRRWPGAATCSRRCRSRSASRWRALLAAMQRHRAAARASCGRACWSASSAARSARSRRSAPTASKVQAALMAELGLGQPEIAWHTVRDRIGEVGCFLGPRHRHARQDLDGREAADADRGRRGLRAVPRGPRLVEHHAAEAQPDLVRSTSMRPPRWCASTSRRCSKPRSPTTSARPGRGRSSGSRCRKSFCSPRARWRRPATWSPASRSTPRACAPISI